MTSKYVWVTTQFSAVHRWKGAPDKTPAWHLRAPHRHTFHVKVTVDVKHNDRQIEFLTLKQQIETVTKTWSNSEEPNHSWPYSCEDFAELLTNYVKIQYPDLQYIEVAVSEDGENGATLVTRYEDSK
jgi:6-pyruvoyl-tetrahydropterin synthase